MNINNLYTFPNEVLLYKNNTKIENKEDNFFSLKVSKEILDKKSSFSEEELKNRIDKIQNYFEKDKERFSKLRDEHNSKVNKYSSSYDPSYDPAVESEFFKDKKIYHFNTIYIDGKVAEIDSLEYDKHYIFFESKNELNADKHFQSTIIHDLTQNKFNKYEDAEQFEAFVNKWMAKGESEQDALSRARLYSLLGLLDYGKQRAISMEHLSVEDKKLHGFHLINNPVLEKTVLDFLDSSSLQDASILYFEVFDFPQFDKEFQEQFSEELQKKDHFLVSLNYFTNKHDINFDKKQFNGDIALKETSSKEYKEFLLETLTKYFTYRMDFVIKDISTLEEDYLKSLSLLKESVDEGSLEFHKKSNALMQSYQEDREHRYYVASIIDKFKEKFESNSKNYIKNLTI